MNRPVKDNRGSWVNIGLYKDCQVNMFLEEGTRVTVKLNERGFIPDTKCTIINPILKYRLYRASCEFCRPVRKARQILGLHSESG